MTMNEFSQEHEPIDETADEVEVRKFLDGPPVEAPPAEPKKRVGWPKGKPRGPRKGKAIKKPKTVTEMAELSGDELSAIGIRDKGMKTFTELMFGVELDTARRMEEMVEEMQLMSRECQRGLKIALMRMLGE